MKEKAASEKVKEEEPENSGHEISFAETQSFEVVATVPQAKEEVKDENIVAEVKPEVVEVQPEKENVEEQSLEEEQTEVKSEWKPMSFESNLPDSLLSKPVEVITSKIETPQEETLQQEEILPKEEVQKILKSLVIFQSKRGDCRRAYN
jgi:hypothetical protein